MYGEINKWFGILMQVFDYQHDYKVLDDPWASEFLAAIAKPYKITTTTKKQKQTENGFIMQCKFVVISESNMSI